MRLRPILAALAVASLTAGLGLAYTPAASADPVCASLPDIRTGYYGSGNRDLTADIAAIGNVEAITQYRSMADGSVWPGYQKAWITALPDDVERSFAIEWKEYGAAHGPQTINGKTVPAAAMHIQRRPGTTFPWAYGYDQTLRGELDPILDRIISQVKAMTAGRPGMRINWQLASEFDTDHEFGTDEAGVTYTWAESDARAVQAIAYVINYARDRGLPDNVTFTVGMAGIWRDSWKRMHPPSLAWLVDGGLQYNAYNHSVPSRDPYVVFNMTKAWTVADLSTRWNSMGIVMEEWGTPASQGDQSDWIDRVPGAISRMNSEPGPKVVRMDYFDSNPPWATLDPRPRGQAALSRMYAGSVFEPCQSAPSASPSTSPSPAPSASSIPSPSPSPSGPPSVAPSAEPSPSVEPSSPPC